MSTTKRWTVEILLDEEDQGTTRAVARLDQRVSARPIHVRDPNICSLFHLPAFPPRRAESRKSSCDSETLT